MSDGVPQPILIEFCQRLEGATNDDWELLIPVVRGSMLMRHWFGDLARPAADLDLECFHKDPTDEQLEDLADMYENEIPEVIYGPWAQYQDPIDYGKAMCREAAQSSSRYRWSQGQHPQPHVEFVEAPAQEGGPSLWVYGTPGTRYFVGWTRLQSDPDLPESGVLQIDIASGGSYKPEELHTAPLKLQALDEMEFQIQAYCPEAMLAAKLSWLLRGLERQFDDAGQPIAPAWTGESKDLFDTHLLLTEGNVDAPKFRDAFLAFCRDDSIMWSSLLALVEEARTTPLPDEAFLQWSEFAHEHAARLEHSPGQMLAEVAERLLPLLGDFYVPDEEHFLSQPRIAAFDLLVLAGVEDPPSDDVFLVYADWLEERGDPRAEFLRDLVLLSATSTADQGPIQQRLVEMLPRISQAWLQRLSGSTSECRRLLRQIQHGST